MPTTKKETTAAKPVNRRDNFSSTVVQILYKRTGGKCCRCSATTFGPVSNNASKSVNIGQAAHIAAAAPGGPRYDPNMTPEERASTGNGMWMCSNCHDIIDRDVDKYPVAKLKEMRKKAEQKAEAAIGVGTTEISDGSDNVSAGVSAATIMDIRKAKAEIRATNGAILSETQADTLLEAVNYIDPDVDHYLVEVGRELTAFYEQLVGHCKVQSIILEVLRRLKIISDAFHVQWSREDVEAMCSVSKRVVASAKPRSRAYQSATALLKDISKYSALKDRSLNKIAIQSLKDLRGSDLTDGDEGTDCTDGAEYPLLKRARLDISCIHEAAGGPPPIRQDYMELMERLSTCENAEEAGEIKEQLIEMGYEPEVY